ncbi:hypothetical protein BU25DRAFT_414916 [Macroventuria anomochaeta]|uniref:Uncharacterized protein n=1 Tax=Macroventuria anomochaeta TaxID=301207 RepID=A0ACB6RMI4_9PLEO|nr:uncharacterized protein BU25DRAFT_414916 [Macroventuria anomochaeta]KAF2622922.1 hypothetical protein BU25DRAFT_414916 [Macroventuria anomochaeta]
MGSKSKRKNVPLSSSEPVKSAKRQRKATWPFNQGVNPAPPTLPPTVRRPICSQEPTLPHNQGTPSPLFMAEDEDLVEDEAANAGLDDDNNNGEMDEQVENVLAASQAMEEPVTADSPGAATAASVTQPSQPQRPESQVEQIDEEPHLHWNYHAWWMSLGKNPIPSAAVSRCKKPLYTVNEDKVWQWADGVVDTQRPWAAIIDSLTATLYYTSGSRQAKADRCTIALQRSRSVAGQRVERGNWFDFEEELAEMEKESGQVMTCDFDLVLKELPATQPATQTQQASQLARGTACARPGIVTAIMEDGLAEVVTNKRFATGYAIGIRDY